VVDFVITVTEVRIHNDRKYITSLPGEFVFNPQLVCMADKVITGCLKMWEPHLPGNFRSYPGL
jgi:hypothetical protein